MRRVLALAFALAAQGCLALPPTSAERLNQAAFHMNSATRFGRMDIAADSVAAEARVDFGKRHRAWGREIRIVDLEVEGVEMLTSDTAQVDLIVSWHRIDDPEIQATTVAQRWTQSASDWKLSEESVAGGSAGLFPSKPKAKDAGSDKRTELGGTVNLP
jgi:hypothetical protein